MPAALAAAPFLRAYNPDAEFAPYTPPQDGQTLPELWHSVLVPKITKRESDKDFLQRNAKWYRTALRSWERIMGDVPASSINLETLAEWRDKRAQSTGRNGEPCSAGTIGREWRYLRAILRMLQEDGIVATVPRLKTPRIVFRAGAKPVVLSETWSQLFAGCRAWHFTRERRIPGPLVGRGILVWLFNTGLRAQDLFGLKRSDVIRSARCPIPGLTSLHNEHGWLYVPECGKTKKPAVIPLLAPARRWFDITATLLPAAAARDGQLLPVGSARSDSRDGHERQSQRRAMHAAAGLDTVYTFHQMRGGANEAWNEADPDAGAWLLGHAATWDVNTRHYCNGVQRLLRAVPQLTLPEAFQQLD